jgi:hypothetical protein
MYSKWLHNISTFSIPRPSKIYPHCILWFMLHNIATFSIPRPSKIYPNCNFWFGNIYHLAALASIHHKTIQADVPQSIKWPALSGIEKSKISIWKGASDGKMKNSVCYHLRSALKWTVVLIGRSSVRIPRAKIKMQICVYYMPSCGVSRFKYKVTVESR